MAKEIKPENYFQVSGWMITELNLKSNELLIYAIIFGFSQDGKSRFTGSIQYLCNWTLLSKQSVISCLKSLVEKGHLQKFVNEKNGVQFMEYIALKNFTGSQNILPGGSNNLTGGGQNFLPNNNILDNNTILNNNYNNKPQKTFEEIKQEKGIMSLEELVMEAINEQTFMDRLMMNFGVLKNMNIETMKYYIKAIYSHWKYDLKLNHDNRREFRAHLINTINRDINGSQRLYNQAILLMKNKKK